MTGLHVTLLAEMVHASGLERALLETTMIAQATPGKVQIVMIESVQVMVIGVNYQKKLCLSGILKAEFIGCEHS